MSIFRKATLDDLQAISDIYNEAIVNTTATFDTQPKTLEEQKDWFNSHKPKYPIIVAEIDGSIVGWAALSEWSDRCAYTDTAEISVYIRNGYRGKGIGSRLINETLQAGKGAGLHTVIARIEKSNATMIHLCEKKGFIHIGIMKEVGRKFNRLLDVVMMQIIL
ncbi:MAG: N-acetyltransferase [candidate division WOR-3 bacterium]|nr:MAG: N-acetyltransferase [candidate division WOR-3 bacterium]